MAEPTPDPRAELIARATARGRRPEAEAHFAARDETYRHTLVGPVTVTPPTGRPAADRIISIPTEMPDGRPIRIAIDADCPSCGYPERFYEPARRVFGCSSLNPQPCGYESTERNR